MAKTKNGNSELPEEPQNEHSEYENAGVDPNQPQDEDLTVTDDSGLVSDEELKELNEDWHDSVGHSSELPEDETPVEPIETETPDAPEDEIVPKDPTSPKEPYENKEPVVIPDDEIPMEETPESSAVHNPKPADTPVEDVPPPHPKDEQAWSAIAARGGV